MGFQSHLSLQPHSHVCQDQLSSYEGLQIANVDGQKHSTYTRSRCSYVARVYTADPRSQLKGSSWTSRLAPGRAETSLQCSFSATLVWMIQWEVEGVENPDTSLVRRLQHHCLFETKTKVGNKANTRKTTESGGEVLKNLTRLWPGSSSTRANRGQSNEGRHRRQKERGKNKEGGRVCAPRIEGKRKLEALISLQSEQSDTEGEIREMDER